MDLYGKWKACESDGNCVCRQGKSCVNKIMFFCSLSFHRKPVQGNYLKKSPCGLGKCAREAGFAQRIPGQLALPAPEPNSADQVDSDYTDKWLQNNTAVDLDENHVPATCHSS